MRRALYIIILALLPIISYAQSIADLTQKAEIEKNPLHIYSSIGFYHNDLYIVRKDNDKEGTYAYGVVDKDGTVYIPVEYDQIEFEKEGREDKTIFINVRKKKNGDLSVLLMAHFCLVNTVALKGTEFGEHARVENMAMYN